jgi:hypothetical protein
MKDNPIICRGLLRAGFRGGWLATRHSIVDHDDAVRLRQQQAQQQTHAG